MATEKAVIRAAQMFTKTGQASKVGLLTAFTAVRAWVARHKDVGLGGAGQRWAQARGAPLCTALARLFRSFKLIQRMRRGVPGIAAAAGGAAGRQLLLGWLCWALRPNPAGRADLDCQTQALFPGAAAQQRQTGPHI